MSPFKCWHPALYLQSWLLDSRLWRMWGKESLRIPNIHKSDWPISTARRAHLSNRTILWRFDSACRGLLESMWDALLLWKSDSSYLWMCGSSSLWLNFSCHLLNSNTFLCTMQFRTNILPLRIPFLIPCTTNKSGQTIKEKICVCTYRAIIKAKFFSVPYVLVGEHSYWILLIPYFVYGLAVRTATMAQPARIVSMQNWIYSQDIVPVWIIQMSFEGDVVEVRQIFREFFSILTLLNYILLFVP